MNITTALSLAQTIIARKNSQPVDLSTRQLTALAEGFMEVYSLLPSEDPADDENKSTANTRQVSGTHYGLSSFQHWDFVVMFKLDYFQGQITKYVMRWRQKNGVDDLKKAAHFLEKYIEVADKVKESAS